MSKPDAALLDIERYPFHSTIETRFTDLDVNRHVNNVAMAGILQEGRVHFHRASDFATSLEGITTMVVSFSVDYIGQAYHPDPLANHAGVLAVGRTSQTVAQLLTQGDRVIALARTVLVCVVDDRPVELSATFRESVGSWMVRA